VDRVEEIRYMGLWWHATLRLAPSHLPHAASVAHCATHGLFARMKSRHIQRPDLQCRLFRTMVRSAFSYGCQVWCSHLLPSLHPTLLDTPVFGPLLLSIPEQAQLHFLRILAGVGTSCHNQSLLHEFGFLPVTFHYVRLAARFWNRILNRATSQPLLFRALRSDIHLMRSGCKVCWSYFFLFTMHKMHLGPDPANLSLAACLELRFQEQAIGELLESKFYSYLHHPDPRCPRLCPSDCVTGRTFSSWLGMQPSRPGPHISHAIPRELRITLTRLRLACSDLEVVKGRFTRRPRHLRLCKAHSFRNPVDGTHPCVEDLRHFVLDCPAYALIRSSPYFAPLFGPIHQDPSLNTPSKKLCHFFNTTHQYMLAVCISRMLTLRAHILSTTPSVLLAQRPTHFPQANHVFSDWWLPGLLDEAPN